MGKHISKKRRQFSIKAILLVTTLVAVSIVFWPKPETGIVERWEQHHWFDGGVGVAKRVGTLNEWEQYSAVYGDGNLCVIRKGKRGLNTTGGSYFKLMIQMPRNLKVGDVVEIKPFNPDSVAIKSEIREMESGTILASKFFNPMAALLIGNSDTLCGTLKILESKKGSIRIQVKLDLELHHSQTIILDEEFELDRSVTKSLLDSPRIDVEHD